MPNTHLFTTNRHTLTQARSEKCFLGGAQGNFLYRAEVAGGMCSHKALPRALGVGGKVISRAAWALSGPPLDMYMLSYATLLSSTTFKGVYKSC